ncbi:MAG: GAF domain-containing protein [Acidobacteriota bacterium]
MFNAPQRTDALILKYRALLDVSKALATHYDLAGLFRNLSEQLRLVVDFEAVIITLYDAQKHLMRRYLLESNIAELADLTAEAAVENSLAGLVWKTQKAYLLNRPEDAAAYPPLMKSLQKNGIQSACILPLTSSGHRLGTIGFGSRRVAAYSDDQLEFLQLLANQVAVAIDNTRNFEQAREAEQQAKRQSEHERLMLEINNAVVSQLDLAELLQIVSPSIRKVIGSDTVGVLLYDQERNQLRAFMTDFPPDHPLAQKGLPIDLEGSPSGLAFTTGQPVYVEKPDLERFDSDLAKRVFDEGTQSGVCIPLIAKGHKLGVLGVTSKHENAFSDEDKALLIQIANQVAIAVDNALNFERARRAEQEVKRQLERERLMLKINNAVVSQLDLLELVRVISSSLRETLELDIASVSLYDPESHQLRAYWFDLSETLPPVEEGTVFPLEGNVGGVAFTTGKALFINRTDPEKAYSDFDQRLIEAGIRSGGCIPLIVQERKLGILAIGSFREDAFSPADQELLIHIANQIAIAVENALNFKRARLAERQAGEERDRANLLLDVNNAIISHLDLNELVKRISASLLDALPHDAAGIALYDAENNYLREYASIAYPGYDAYPQGEIFRLTGTAVGLVFTSGEPLLLRRPDAERFPADRLPLPGENMPRSACLVPLISHGRKLGVLGVGSNQEDRFAQSDLDRFAQIAGQVAIAVENALAYREIESLKNKLASEKLYLEQEIQTEYNFAEIIGQSLTLKRILKQVETVAPTDSVVLIQGETGTGKELIARAIHNLSNRSERTMVKLNCAAIPTGLLESELFGHEKGAFTGAVAQRIGRFELAHRGTLFLDEVGDIPLELQPKLLRVLQESEFERLGSSRTLRVDVRLIAATNCDLAQMVEEKKYRGDLFYRLNVFPLRIPPLRERAEDIPLLVGYFIQKHSRRMNKRIESVRAEDMQALIAYHWSGNVRELENFIERAVILSKGSQLEVPLSELRKPSETIPHQTTTMPTKLVSLEDHERQYIQEVLRQTNGVIGGKGGAAEILDLPISTLRSRMKKLGLK